VFNAIFAQLKQLGFYKHKGIQRTDSLAIYTHCRLLKRIELCVKTMRAVIKELLHRDPSWTRAALPVEWEERYAKRCKSERLSEEERQSLAIVVGDDGQWLLERLAQEDAAHLAELRAVETLRDVWAIHYERGSDGHLRWTENTTRGGTDIVETPHDPEARWSAKQSSDWVGYKLQVTEIDDVDCPHLITDIAVTAAPQSDMTALIEIRAHQEQQNTLPGERFVDCGYVSGSNIKDGRTNGEELIGPIRTTVTPQSKLPNGFAHADFQIDFELRQVRCPGGQTTSIISSGKNGLQAVFPRKTCAACPLRPRCCTGKKEGRGLSFGPQYVETQAARQRQQTDQFKARYRAHRGGVEGCLSVLVQCSGHSHHALRGPSQE
jgi:transposase